MNRVMHAAMDITARAPIATANAFALACEGQFQQASTVMPLVFISYSRKDFYFAESLAFHLTKRGIANWLDANHLTPGSDWAADIDRALDQAGTVIVVLTPDSLRSKYVRGEWQRALQQGDRILFAQFRSCVPPAELRDAEMIDFRGRFRLALERLIARIKADRVAQVDRNRRSFGVPPWVLVFTITLFLISIVPFAILGDWNTGELVREPVWFQVLCWIFAPFFFGFLLWHLAIAFLRRRMGMTRLALTISFFTGLFAFYLSGQLRLIEPITAWMVQNHVPHMSLLVLIGVPLLGVVALAILLLVRPEDLLRWCSTGKAWDIYRRGRVVQVPDVATRLAQLGTFHLLHDHEDAPAAARLGQQLLAVGNTESMPATTSGVQILFLTNRTRAAWAGEKALRLTSDLITIVGSAISLPESLRRHFFRTRLARLLGGDRLLHLVFPGMAIGPTHHHASPFSASP